MQILNFIQKKKVRSVLVFMFINPLMTGGPIKELKAGHDVDYCRIFMSGWVYLRSRGHLSMEKGEAIFIFLSKSEICLISIFYFFKIVLVIIIMIIMKKIIMKNKLNPINERHKRVNDMSRFLLCAGAIPKSSFAK